MRIVPLLVVGSAVSVVAVASFAFQAPQAPSTIENCATLLPKGKTYTFSFTGSIDNTGPEPKLSGELSVSDDTTVDRSREGVAFGECIAKLVR